MQKSTLSLVSTSPSLLWAQTDFLPHSSCRSQTKHCRCHCHCQECQLPHWLQHLLQQCSHKLSSCALHTIIGQKGSGKSLPIARRLCLHSPSDTHTSPIERLSPVAFRLHIIFCRRRIKINGKNFKLVLRQRKQPSQLRRSQVLHRDAHCEAKCLELLDQVEGTAVTRVPRQRYRYRYSVKEAVSAVAIDTSSRRLQSRCQQPTPRERPKRPP